jgi:hypothetical protein
VRHFVTALSLTVAALLAGAPAAVATPMRPLFGQPPSPEHVSARIFPSEFDRRIANLAVGVLFRESIADAASGRSRAIAGSGGLGAEPSLFHSPVSLTLGKTDVSEALESIAGPRALNRSR